MKEKRKQGIGEEMQAKVLWEMIIAPPGVGWKKCIYDVALRGRWSSNPPFLAFLGHKKGTAMTSWRTLPSRMEK